MLEPCSMTLTCVEEAKRIHQGYKTFSRLYVRALFDDVNLHERGQDNPPRMRDLSEVVCQSFCLMTLTCVEEVKRILQGCETFFRLYVRALLDDVNLYGRGRENPPMMQDLSEGDLQLRTYADADWAADPTDRKSISGFCMFLGSSLISWFVKKQVIAAKSSTKAKNISLSFATSGEKRKEKNIALKVDDSESDQSQPEDGDDIALMTRKPRHVKSDCPNLKATPSKEKVKEKTNQVKECLGKVIEREFLQVEREGFTRLLKGKNLFCILVTSLPFIFLVAMEKIFEEYLDIGVSLAAISYDMTCVISGQFMTAAGPALSPFAHTRFCLATFRVIKFGRVNLGLGGFFLPRTVINLATGHRDIVGMSLSICTLVPLSHLRKTSRHVAIGFSQPKSLWRSKISMSVSVGSRQHTFDESLFIDYKPSYAFLFPGQGAQTLGMGAEAQGVPAAAELFRKANDILGFDLLDACTNGPKEKLDSTVISQPAIYVTSLAAVEVLRARDGGPDIIDSVDVTCGLSLGEYTALAFAGAFSFEDGLKLVKLRGEAMQDASDAAESAMVSVIGLDSDKVQLLCDAANEEVDEKNKVQIANYLCPVRLAVAGAFHTSFMEPAVSRLETALAATEIRTPRIPVISNVDAQPHSNPDKIKNILALQVTSPVQWELTVKTLLGKGLKKSYELGPGKVIAGILKRMDKSAEIENIGA
ncbi:hypothetical protein KFK09_007301 [Dendrobium nobile]|uniref:Malonyl-CoA:ACP transacylase (MAT) domain-containing protein n=1 Tax=Dendrobium nobile TaxID=94219 RepID=A0A8T3BTQ2_DENNO|nr:hypothetical protein KFK09_007301 [Dendrobium nobile]